MIDEKPWGVGSGTMRCAPNLRLAPSGTTPHPPRSYVSFPIGSFLTRLPVRAKMALHTAGAIGGAPGSPVAPSASVVRTPQTPTPGASGIPHLQVGWKVPRTTPPRSVVDF